MAPYISFGSFHLPTYFLIISLLCTLGVVVLPKWAERFGLSEGLGAKLYMLILLSGFLGARVFHAIFEAPEIYQKDPFLFFAVWEGGFVFLGGVIFALLASWFWLKKQGEDFFLWGDVFAPWMAFGYAFGRIACFFNGCCYGTECYLPWAVKFPSHMFTIEPFVSRHPTQTYSFLAEIIIFFALILWLEKRRGKLEAFKNSGRIFCTWIMLHGFSRFIIEQFRDDDRGPLILGLSLSSLISILLIGIGFWTLILKRKTPS